MVAVELLISNAWLTRMNGTNKNMVLSPEHKLVDSITTAAQRDAVTAYKTAVSKKSDLERTELSKEKTGVFTGAYAINPVNNDRIPIWIADYVLASYGTGAIMNALQPSPPLRLPNR